MPSTRFKTSLQSQKLPYIPGWDLHSVVKSPANRMAILLLSDFLKFNSGGILCIFPLPDQWKFVTGRRWHAVIQN